MQNGRESLRFTWAMLAISSLILVTGDLSMAQQNESLEDPQANQDGRWVAQQPAFTNQQIEFFESSIRPLLVKHCYDCHSQQSSYAEGGLYLDSRQGLFRGGDSGPAVDLEDHAKSILLDAINYGQLFEMPPSSKLPADEIELLTRWIEMGAPWPLEDVNSRVITSKFDIEELKQQHWSWQPPALSDVPTVADSDWARSPIDRYIFQKMSLQQVEPNPIAAKEALIRRVYFDLIGLPPSPQQVDAFVTDLDENAWEKVVDQLLDSPHFGERWARHWMDLVRYAETHGHEFDFPIPHAHEYRDYLIRAFNEDVPYDQLIVEHLAGDLMEHPRLNTADGYNESVLGTGFWFLGEAVHAPVDVRADQAGRIDNQIDVFTKTFLGLTVACARCHDHKFDAISIEDYYSLVGFLQSSRRQEVLLDPHRKIEAMTDTIKPKVAESDLQASAVMESFRRLDQDSLQRPIQALFEAAQVTSNGAVTKETSIALSRTEKSGTSKVPTETDLHERLIVLSENELQKIASKHGISTKLLENWIAAIDDPLPLDISHPVFLLKEILSRSIGLPDSKFSEIHDSLRIEFDEALASASRSRSAGKRFTNFQETDFQNWYRTGFAFSRTDQVTSGTVSSGLLLPPDLAHSGRLGLKQFGVLRSPTFTIEHAKVHYRLLASQVQIRLVIDGFGMDIFNPLLFEGMSFKPETQGKFSWHVQSGDLRKYLGHRGYIEIIDHGDGFAAIDEIWFSDGDSPNEFPSQIASETLQQPMGSTTDFVKSFVNATLGDRPELTRDQVDLVNWIVQHELTPAIMEDSVGRLRQGQGEIQDLQAKLDRPRMAVGITDGNGVDERLFIRGNHRNLGAVVPRNMLTALRYGDDSGDQARDSWRSDSPTGSGRLFLAEQIASADNPLTARVIVNRLWHHLMGRGIVTSIDNFGVLGEPPTHPELLDFLALDFIEQGWSIKRMLKQIVLSRSYQLSSQSVLANEQLDPNNRLFHRAMVRRLQGEAIRDAMLVVSGNLDPTMYGSSIQIHLTSFMQGRGRPGRSGPLDGKGRRSIYQEVRRNFLSPMMLAFDTPIPFNTIGRRTESNVPGQALILMNSPFVHQQAKLWAQRAIQEESDPPRRIEWLYRQAFARPPSEFEIRQAFRFLQQQAACSDVDWTTDSDHVGIWCDYCHVLFNVKEFIFLR